MFFFYPAYFNRRVFVITGNVDNTHIFIQVQCFAAGWLSGVINLPLMADHCQTSLSVTFKHINGLLQDY